MVGIFELIYQLNWNFKISEIINMYNIYSWISLRIFNIHISAWHVFSSNQFTLCTVINFIGNFLLQLTQYLCLNVFFFLLLLFDLQQYYNTNHVIIILWNNVKRAVKSCYYYMHKLPLNVFVLHSTVGQGGPLSSIYYGKSIRVCIVLDTCATTYVCFIVFNNRQHVEKPWP